MGNTLNEGWQQKLDYDWGNTPENAKMWITRALQHLDPARKEKLTAYYMGMTDGSPQSMTDIMYTVPKARVAEKAGRKAPAYIYRYDYASKGMHESGYHACHGSDCVALFAIKNSRMRCTDEQIAAGAWRACRPATSAPSRRPAILPCPTRPGPSTRRRKN